LNDTLNENLIIGSAALFFLYFTNTSIAYDFFIFKKRNKINDFFGNFGYDFILFEKKK
jgi:hypothetical protein